MSFAEFETSLQNGRPVRLYQFQRGPLKWGYTNADRNINHQGITFRSPVGGISDDGIRQTARTFCNHRQDRCSNQNNNHQVFELI